MLYFFLLTKNMIYGCEIFILRVLIFVIFRIITDILLCGLSICKSIPGLFWNDNEWNITIGNIRGKSYKSSMLMLCNKINAKL